MEERELPKAAVVVAVVQVVIGGWALFDVLGALLRGQISINPMVLFLIAGIGLLARRGWARLLGRALHTLVALLVPTCVGLAALGIGTGASPAVMSPWNGATPAVIAIVIAVAVGVYAVNIWAIVVLGRADVVAACRR